MQQATDNGAALAVIERVAPSREVLFKEWCDWMIHKQLAPATIKMYSRTVQKAWDALDLPNVTEEDLQEWNQAQRGKAGTIGNRVCALMSFFRFLTKTKRRPDNPAQELERPKIHKRLPKPVEDLDDVLEKCRRVDEVANDKGAIPRRVGETEDMVIFLCYTGLRMHEAVKCDWLIPCPEEGLIIGKGDKEELMQIHPKAREAWDRIGGKWPIGVRATQRRLEKVGIHPHMCRHWRATSLVRAGAEIGVVSKIMRHSSVQTTMGYSAYAKKQMTDTLNMVS